MISNFFKKPSFKEYLILREQLEGIYRETEVLAKKYSELSKAVELSINQPTFDEINRIYNSFNKDYISSLKSLNIKRKSLIDKIQKMKDSVISKEINSHVVKEEINKAISNFQKGDLIESEFTNIYRSLSGQEKIKYADILLRNSKGQLLILQRASTDKSNAGKWGVPGGHVDYGEDCLEAAKRELFEETGIKKEYLEQVGEYEDDKVHIKYYTGYCHDDNPNILLDNEEHHDYKWIHPYHELMDYEMPFNMRDNLNKILNPFQKQILKFKKALDSNLITFDAYHSLVSNMLKNKSQIINKALSDDIKLQIEDYIINYKGEFNDDEVHRYAEKLGINYEEMEEYIFSIARKYLKEYEQ